jgi:phage gpG-like protein
MKAPKSSIALGVAGMTGAFQEYEALAESFEWLAENWQDEVSKRLAEKTLALANQCFQEQRDPYGEPWLPSKRAIVARRSGGAWFGFHYTLVESGRLLLSFYETHDRHGFNIISHVPYANIHQYGGPIGGFLAGKGVEMPRRSWLPRDGVEPETWVVEYREEANEVFEAAFRTVGGGATVRVS